MSLLLFSSPLYFLFYINLLHSGAQNRGPFPKHLLCHWNDTPFLCREKYEIEMLIYHFSMKLYLNLSCQSPFSLSLSLFFFMNNDSTSVALIFCFCFGFLTSLYISKHIMSYLLTHCRLNDIVKYVPHSVSPYSIKSVSLMIRLLKGIK